MTGILTTAKGKFIFRTDNQNDYSIVGWLICEVKPITHKWLKLPKGTVELFDIDNPPKTVSYLPDLN